jgi:GTP-binding protein HflX
LLKKAVKLEKVVLVGIRHVRESLSASRESLYELERLTRTAGGHVVAMTQQEVKSIDPATYIRKGKIDMIAELVARYGAESIVFDEDLSPRQNRNLEEALGHKVVDRTGLILDIFAQHATSKEGKLQVTLAQHIYLMPRLVGAWGHFGKLGGGIGTRGPGETQLEVDRRRAREKITQIRRALRKVERSRYLHRQKREGVPIPTVALVGYTNAGKSTLMNAMTNAGVLTEDKLFATLDPTVRRLKLPSGRQVLLSDTVGFIRKLPHPLVEAFKATFEEVRAADLLLHVIDVSHPMRDQQKAVVDFVLQDLGLDRKPLIEVYNKLDLLGPSAVNGGGIRVSAREGSGILKLLGVIEDRLSQDFKTLRVKIPYDKSGRVEWLYRVGEVKSRKDRQDGVYMKVSLSAADEARIRRDENIKVRVL